LQSGKSGYWQACQQGRWCTLVSATLPCRSRTYNDKNECPAKYGMKRCSDGMFSACRASVFQTLFFVFFIFHRGTLRNEPVRGHGCCLLGRHSHHTGHCFSGQLRLESPTFRPSLCSAATPAATGMGSGGSRHRGSACEAEGDRVGSRRAPSRADGGTSDPIGVFGAIYN